MGEQHQMAMPIALGRAELVAAAADIANRLPRPQAPLPVDGQFPDAVVEEPPAGRPTPQAFVPAPKRPRRRFTADTVAVFARADAVRVRGGMVEISPVTSVKVRGSWDNRFWVMVPRQVLERGGYYVPGQRSGPACVHPLVRGATLMVRFTKNRLALEIRPATTGEIDAAPAHEGGGHA